MFCFPLITEQLASRQTSTSSGGDKDECQHSLPTAEDIYRYSKQISYLSQKNYYKSIELNLTNSYF